MLHRYNPQAQLVLHMQCEWLSQIDPALARQYLTDIDQILSCSDLVTARIVAQYPDYAAYTSTLHNAVEVSRFVPHLRIDSAPSDVKRLLYVGRVSLKKGFMFCFMPLNRFSLGIRTPNWTSWVRCRHQTMNT
jgi:glycosyltransferase involved in cell wall biosynthesis